MTQEKKWEYEFIFVLPPNLEKQDQTSLFTKVKEVIAKGEGKVVKETDWGQKDLAYPIKDRVRGQYFIWQVSFPKNPSLRNTDLLLNRETNVLRYLWVKL